MAVILASVAIRLLQLKEDVEKNKEKNSFQVKRNPFLSQEEMAILWFSMQPKNQTRQPLTVV